MTGSRTWIRPPVAESLLTRLTEDQKAIAEAMRPVALPDGRALRVLDCGDEGGDAVVLLPMVTELNFVYAPQIAEFQHDHRVVLYEPLLSTSTRVGIHDRAHEVRSLLTALGITRAHFVVWGDTGAAAYHLAKTHPELCHSVVFIGLADRYRFPQPYGLLLKALHHLPIERMVSAGVFATLLGRFVGGTQIKPEWIVQKAWGVRRLTALFKHSILPNLTDHRPLPGEVRVPSLVICGDRDRIVSAAQAQRMAALLPHAGAAVIKPGGEHFVNYIDDAFVNETVRRFFATVA
jgi:pimeloyl-ACP methyl ester carboxylesterase